MTKRQAYKVGVRVRIRDKVPYYRGSIGPITSVEAKPTGSRRLVVDIPGDGPTYFGEHEVELAPETEVTQ
jgi:hypothetical protein